MESVGNGQNETETISSSKTFGCGNFAVVFTRRAIPRFSRLGCFFVRVLDHWSANKLNKKYFGGTWTSRKRNHQRRSAWYQATEPEFQMLSIKVNLWWRIRDSGCFVFKYTGRVQPQHGPSFIRVGILRENKLKKVLFFPKREKGVCFLHSGCLVYDRFSNLHIALRFFSANYSRYPFWLSAGCFGVV